MPASTSETEVTMFAGRINCKNAFVLFNDQSLTDDDR